MSRKSRYVSETRSYQIDNKWKAGAYIRLSKEDETKKGGDSESVVAQKKIIEQFISENSGICLSGYYTDDGYSGTNTERPAFQQMISDVKNGRINCVIVKDLSRFARNDDEAGRYIYVIFPFFKIRFISVTDRVDSFEAPESVNGLELPFKNIMHSEYSRDLSKKVISSSDARRRKGEYVGAFCKYGYKKDEKDRHRLIPDEEAADIVRFIFNRYIETGSARRVAKELTEKNIPTPMDYKLNHGSRLALPGKNVRVSFWRSETIRRILTDEVYIGNLIQGKRRKISYKSTKIINADLSRWIRVENTHEGIVPFEVFDRVQSMLARGKFVRAETRHKNIFAGRIFCADCNAALRALWGGKNHQICYFACTTSLMKKGACTSKRIRSDRLEAVVLNIINVYAKCFADLYGVLQVVSGNLSRSEEKNEAAQIRKEIEECNAGRSKLYFSYKSGEINEASYRRERLRLDTSIKRLKEQLNRSESISEERRQNISFNRFHDFVKEGQFSLLTDEMLDKFVKRIVVYGAGRIEIEFTFDDEIPRIKETLEKLSTISGGQMSTEKNVV